MALSRKIAYIDLDTGKVNTAVISPDLRKQYLGGRGLNIHYLSEKLKANGPLVRDNVIVVGAGLLGGTLASASGRTHIASKSPATGYLGGANIGGYFAPSLRWSGFDHLVISGKAPRPSFVLVHDGKVRILDASFLWGQTVPDTQEILRKELEDEEIQALCIGPAGENQVRYAGVANGHQGASWRDGMGAVFGSMNLKAIVAKGSGGIKIEYPNEAIEYDRGMVGTLTIGEFGRGMQTTGVSSLDGLDVQRLSDYIVGADSCHNCQLHCWDRYVIKTGTHAGTYGQGPGYRVRQAWVEVLGDQADSILVANYLASLYGLDNLETANLIGWAIELYEEGVLTKAATGGLELHSENGEAIFELIGQIARREGLGKVLADGGTEAARKVGAESEKYIRQTKGVADLFGEAPTPWQALGVATATRACDHIRYLPANDPCRLPEPVMKDMFNKPVPYEGPLSSDCWDGAGKPWMVYWREMCSMAADMLGVCDFHTALFSPEGPGFDDFSKMVRLNTGLDLSPVEIWEAASRAYDLERQFNMCEGYTDKDDLLGFSRATGGSLEAHDFQSLLPEYYALHGWDRQGNPDNERNAPASVAGQGRGST